MGYYSEAIIKHIVTNVATEGKEEYQKFFKSALSKFGVKSPAELDTEKKKEFFNYIDKNYTAEKEAIDMKAKAQNKKLKDAEGEEEPKGKKMGNVVVHGETVKPFFHPNKMKEALAKVWSEKLDDKDKEDVKKTADMLAKASKAHAAQSKDLKKQIKD